MITHVLVHTLPAAYALLPPAMQSVEATAFLLAIGLQESRFEDRRQLRGGPARGFWQCELRGGVALTLQHPASRAPMISVLRQLRYALPPDPIAVHLAIEHNDVLAACLARCYLWTHPAALPGPADVEQAWQQYLAVWNPGAPHRETWRGYYLIAWGAVLKGRTPPATTNV